MASAKENFKQPVINSQRPKKAIIKKKTLYFRFNRVVTNLFNFFYRKGLKYHALNSEESLQLLLKSKKTYIRFGNGESEILVGLDMATQIYDKCLQGALVKITKDYGPNCNYLLGLTNWNLTQSVKDLKTLRKFKIWRFMRYIFFKLEINKIDMPFLETDMFRSEAIGLPIKKIELLWKDTSNIIMVHNTEKYFRCFSKEYKDKHIYFVKIPDKNFFSVLSETQDKIIKIINDNNIYKNDLIVMVSAGPGANVLCYNLCQKNENILCYDMGNFFHTHYHTSR
jgi:hypothetical protein